MFKRKKTIDEGGYNNTPEGYIKSPSSAKILFRRNWKKMVLYILLALILIAVVLARIFVFYIKGNPIDANKNDPIVPVDKPRDNINAVDKILDRGEYEVGVDIAQGRYIAKAVEGFGSFIVYQPDAKMPEVNEILNINYGAYDPPGTPSEAAPAPNEIPVPKYGVPDVTFTLLNGQFIKIENKKNVFRVELIPVPTEMKTVLTAGLWEVGVDILPGTYVITTDEPRMGTVTVYKGTEDEGFMPEAKKEIGINAMGEVKEQAIITLKDDQLIRVSSIASMKFDKR